jgi:hypothetical protein
MYAQARFSWLPARSRSLMVCLPLVTLAILLGVQCVIGAISASSHQSALSEYLNQARRCVELNDCPSRGGRTGGLPLFHGASWIRLLSYSLRAGYDLTRIQYIVLGSWILSIPTTFFFLKRYLGLRAAALALGLYFPLILVATDITIFSYPNLLPLPFALYYASIALFIEFRRTVFGAVASVALAAAVSAELGSIVMVPFHVLLVALTARRPVFAVAVCSLSFAIPFCLDSMDAAWEIVRQVPTIRFAVGLAISGGVVVLAARMSPRVLLLASTSTPDRVRAVMTAALLYATITIWLACLLLMRALPSSRYLLPASFPFLYLVAERMGTFGARTTIILGTLESLSLLLLPSAPHGLFVLQVPVVVIVTLYALGTIVRQMSGSGPGSLWPSVTICLCAIGVAIADIIVLSKRGAAQAFTLAEVERLVPKLYSAGYTYPELLGSLQGPAADDLMPLLTERDPNLFGKPLHLVDPNFSLLVVKVPNAAIVRTRGIIAAVPVGDSRSAIVVRGERSYLDWIHMRRCDSTSDRGRAASYGCVEPRTDRPVPHNWPYVEFGEPVPSSNTNLPDHRYGRSVHFEVPVHTPGHGTPHIVRAADEWPATWRIARVSGVEFEGKLPGAEIRLPDGREATGVVEFEFTAAAPVDLPWVWVPHVIEVAQANEPLLEPFRSVR